MLKIPHNAESRFASALSYWYGLFWTAHSCYDK